MSAPNLTIETVAAEPVGVVRLAGSVYLPDVFPLMAALTRALRTAPHQVIVCDVADLEPVASETVLTAFPSALRRCGGWPHASLHLAGAAPDLGRQLQRMRMPRYLPVHPTLADALAQAELDIVAAPRELRLAPRPESLRLAREAVRELWPGSFVQGCEETMLVVNELAANAIRHVARPFTVSLAVSSDRVLVAVTDPSRSEPILRPARAAATTTGRGMHVVSGLSDGWGVRLVHPQGKTVWARLPAPAPVVPRSRTAALG